MPSDSVLLPGSISVALIFVIIGIVLWIKDRRGRGLRSIGVGLGVIGLYLTGLLNLLWSAGVALVGWARQLVLDPRIWAGLGLLALMVVLWIVGGYLMNRRVKAKARGEVGRGHGGSQPAVQRRSSTTGGTEIGTQSGTRAGGGQGLDSEDAEIEALLKKRGIS